MSSVVKIGLVAIAAIVVFYFFLFYLISMTQVASDRQYCEYTDGDWNGPKTGNRFIYNAWTLGSTGECREAER